MSEFKGELILCLLLIIVVTISCCTTEPHEYTETTTQEQQRTTEVIEEYNKYVNLYNNDSAKIINLYNSWIDAYNNATEDNQLTNTEVVHMYNAADEYVYEHRIVMQHLTNWRYFININKQTLKNSGIDVFEARMSIEDTIIRLENNVDHMKANIEYLIEKYIEYQEKLMNIYKILRESV